MKWAVVPYIVLFYILIVFCGVVLLAGVQLRSSGGATPDTWRLNYEANRVLNDDLLRKLAAASEKAKENASGVNFN